MMGTQTPHETIIQSEKLISGVGSKG